MSGKVGMMKHNVYLIGLCLLVGLWSCGGDNPMTPDPDLEPKVDHTAGDLVIDLPNGVKMAFMWIEPGTFTMGSPTEPYMGPQHEVTISKGFYLGKYEVTQQQWLSLIGTEPWIGQIDSIGINIPALSVTWIETQNFLTKLQATENGSIYRLPTEAEWEYTCRAGTKTQWSFGDDVLLVSDYAWHETNSKDQPHIVGAKLPNFWGIYDMHGNAWEWTNDWWGDSYLPELQIDPLGPETPTQSEFETFSHVLRGGNFGMPGIWMKCSSRSRVRWYTTGFSIGFRVLREGPKISQP